MSAQLQSTRIGRRRTRNGGRRLRMVLVANGNVAEAGRNYNLNQRVALHPHHVDLELLVRKEALVDAVLPRNTTVRRPRFGGPLGFYLEEAALLARARRNRIDVVTTGRTAESILAWLWRPFGRYRWVSDIWDPPHKELVTYYADVRTMHGRARRTASRLKTGILRMILRRSDLVIASVLPEALAGYDVPPQKLRLFPNAIHLEGIEQPDSVGRVPNSVCFVSSLFLSDRGLGTLAKACDVMRRDIDVRVYLAGRVGEGLCDFTRLNREGVFEFLGPIPVDAAHDLMRRSEIGVLPYSANEDLSYIHPIKLLEYMAYGAVVVGSALPGISSTARDGVDGILVPPDDAEALASAIARVLEDDLLREALRKSAYERVKQFDARAKALQVYDAIAECCETT